MTPKPGHGFNLVGVDDFEEPGDELYFVANYATREEAEAARARREEKNPGEILYVYGPEACG